MTIIVLSALGLSLFIYIVVSFVIARKTKDVADMIPIASGQQAAVKSTAEFSASTVAATISLTTVIIAFYELAPYFGYWLFWCVLTTSTGIYVVQIFAKKIWKKLNGYGELLTLHSFLAKEYGSGTVSIIGATATSLGFMGAFAVELTVGSRFLASLMPGFPPSFAIALLSVAAFGYTALGGFRAVIVTDKIQMVAIWLLLCCLTAYYIYFISTNGGFNAQYAKIPSEVKTLTWRGGLASFMIGIFIINVPTYIADMSVWQRIAATSSPDIIYKGLRASVINSAITWTIIVLLSCFVLLFVPVSDGHNTLFAFMNYLGNAGNAGRAVLFISVTGLFAAMLSTASTQLIVTGHSIYEDVICKIRHLPVRTRLKKSSELRLSRIVLILSALVSVGLVEVLNYFKFSIADLIFAIYGSQIGLTSPVILALFYDKQKLSKLKYWAMASIIAGFVTGWGAAVFGKLSDNSDLVFLSPCVSLMSSLTILMVGLLLNRKK